MRKATALGDALGAGVVLNNAPLARPVAPLTDADRPLSLTFDDDPTCLRVLIGLHAVPAPVIADVTYGSGRIWRGLPYRPIRVDNNPSLKHLDHVADFRALPFEDASIDVLVFDPPHLTEAGATSKFAERFGLLADDVQHHADISHLFEPFLREARRVLRPDGIVLAKLTDQVHRDHFRWQTNDWINAVKATQGLTACDRRIRARTGAASMRGHNWQRVVHLRRAEVFWFVVRKGACRPRHTRG